MNKILLSISLIFSFSVLTSAQQTVFSDDFESYLAGQQLACQNPTDWTTWTSAPCGGEDAMVSSAQALSGTKSFVVVPVNDLVKPLNDIASGKWEMRWSMYLPTGRSAYFNTLSIFAAGTSEWAMQAYLNVGGTGTLDAGATSAATFSYPYNTWFPVSVIVDIDNDV
ncbi:MAG: hypothetical protein ACHQLA_03545, partial [Ignavibacteriales bacterium]